ncbi:Kinesin-like protein KIF15 [Hordeum vulgare]|nr:Kinesin-like protein KIF15 [Hordeum vulgare]
MMRDLGAARRTPARASASETGNDENAPGDGSDAAAAALLGAAESRPPLLAIQPQVSGLKRKPESPAPTPSKLPFRTPEKAAARSRFGWAPPRAEELPPRMGATTMTTPRAHRGKAVPAASSEGGSTHSTPTKSVSKPAYSVGPRPVTSGGARGPGSGLGCSMAVRGAPASFGPATVVSSVEVPQFELREDPSFWMDNNVQVVIRVRPLNNSEKTLHGYNRCLKQESAQTITWIGQPETRFTFDHVACEGVNQEVLFRVAGLPMVENCMAGYNSCVFAYGQTGSGKTYTMLGEISDLEVRPSPERGMTPRIFEFLFARIRAEEESRRDEKLKYNCKCSFLEIYNEQITDLLDPSSTNLALREDTRNGVYVENLTELEVGCVNDIIKLLMQGSMNRKVAATNMNRESSRSHSVFTCIIESTWEKDATTNFRFARLNLVDLAGSERQRTSGAEGERLKEAANINKSLSTLGLVIMSLVDLTNGKQRHVPYRDSRLTFLLQDSLGGNSKTMIIANVSSSLCSGNETLSTLKFAQRARLIQNNAVVNEDASGDVLALQHQIRLLKEELAVLKRQHVTRSLPFSTDICGRTGGHGDDGSDHMSVDEENVSAQGIKSLEDLRISNKQMKSLEETLAGALRRESMAESTIKQLEAEIEQLNRLVSQREEDTRCAKMTLKFREDKINRMEALVHNNLPAESYLLEDNKTLSREIELLRAKVDKNPEVTRFALENIRLSNQLKRYQQFCNEGEREVLLDEVSNIRNQVAQMLEGRVLTEQQNKLSANFEDAEHHSNLPSEPETLPKELTRACQELETCRSELQGCLESNEKLTREIADLQKELSTIKMTKREECHNVFEYGSNARAKVEDCSDEAFMANTDDILNLQLELDILKTILAEERTVRGEVEEKTTTLSDQLKAANLRILQACKQSDAIGSELNDARSVIEALESQQILLINELDELRKNNQKSFEILKKRGREISRLNTEIDNHRIQGLVASGEPKTQLLKCIENEDSPLQRKLKRMQASLEKANDLNTRYQRDQASDSSAEQEMDEVRRQVEVETTEVIMCLQEELMSLQQQVDASNKNELLAKQSLDELQLERKELNDRLFEVMKENESLSELTKEKEKKIHLLTNDQESLQEDLISLQQQLDASNKKELLAKQSLDELQLERKQLNDRLLEVMEENERFTELIEGKEEKIQLLTDDKESVHEELSSLQQQLDASNKYELLAKQSLDELQLEKKELNDRLLEAMKQNGSFSQLFEEKEKKIQHLTNDWENLQEEFLSLQQQLDASNKNELLAKQSLDELQLERKQLNDRLLEVMKENEGFSVLTEEKEKEIQLLTRDWDRLAADIGSFLVEGNASLDEASDQVAFISESFPQRRWVEDQVQKMCQGISDREKLLEELQSRLKEADGIKCDLDLKLRSLRGAMEAINEMHQQERNDQEKAVALLRSQVSEQGQVNQQQLEQFHRVELLLDESIGTFVQKEVLEQNYVSSLRGMEEEIHQLKTQLDQSKTHIAHSLSQTKDKEQKFEKLKNEENTILLRMLSDVLKAKGIIHEFGVGFNTLESSFSVDPEEVVCQNSDLNLEDRAELKTFGALEAGEQCNADALCQLSKEMESAVYKLQTLQSQMAKLLQEKENMKECLLQSRRTVQDLNSEVLQLKSQMIDQQARYEARVEELEIKIQGKDNDVATSLVSWHKEIEALESELSETKVLAQQKSFEAFTLIAKFHDAQATIADADSTVKALVEANENAKLLAEKYKQKEASYIVEKNDLLNEVSSLKMMLDVKGQNYLDMEKKLESSLLEANEVALELEDGIRCLKNLLSENLEFVSSDVKWMKSKLRQFTELARTWLEENWLEIIGKDCAVSVLHLCHMGILLERITGLHAENGFLQRGICESNSLISMLRQHNDKAKNELEMCSVLKGKLLLDINHSFGCVAKKEQEATELSSRLDSFGKKVLHLQAQEEAMLARSDSIYNELSALTKEIDATNRSSLAAETKEKEELHNQLDEALFLNGMLKDTMLEVLSLSEVNSVIPAEDMKGCNEFELCSWFVNYHHDSIMINAIASDIEFIVLASEVEQEKIQLQTQNLMFTEVLEGLKTEATLWKVDQDLGNLAIYSLHEENSNTRIDLENLKRNKDEVMESLLATREENSKLRHVVDSLESNIKSLQTDLDGKVKALMELQCSHAALCKELESKAEVIELGISRENVLRSENDLLKHEKLDILCKDRRMLHLVSNIDMEKLSYSFQAYLDQINTEVEKHIDEQLATVMKFSNDLNLVQLSVEELSTHNSFLQSELARKDELAKGLSFDLSLLQESASVAKDQADQLIELTEAITSLQHEVASKSHDLDNLVSGSQLLEAQVMKSNEKILVLEEQLASTVGERNAVSMENTELRSQLNHIEQIGYSMKEELAHRSNATERMEEELIELRNLLDERNIFLQHLQDNFSKLSDEKQYCDSQVLLLREKLEMAQAVAEESEAIATEARQIADERKTYAEEKDEEVKLLERSIEELESTIFALENQVGNIKDEAERQRTQREELEVELQRVRHQMSSVPSSGKVKSFGEDGMVDSSDSLSHSREIHTELLSALESIKILQKEVAEKESEIAQCKSHISELNLHAEAAAREYKQKFMELEAMAHQVNTDNPSTNACSMRPEKISSKPRGSGSPFKCIGLGFVQQVNSEKDEDLSAAKQRIVELEGIAASRQREIFMLNAKLATTESMTHDVIRDMLGVKMNMTTWATLVDKQQKMSTKESVAYQTEESKESNELMKLKQQLDEFIEERQSWIDEINQRQSELGAARITVEQLRQKEHFMVAEVDLLKAENANYKTIIFNLEDEVKKLTRKQNLQLRINHHVKTKEENVLLKKHNEELSAKLQQLGTVVTRTKEKLARYMVSDGKDPHEQIEEEELLRKKLEESEQDRSKLAENLSSLCTSVLKAAGVRNHESEASLVKAMEALNQLQCCISSLESEVEDLRIKCKLLREKARLTSLRSDSSSASSGANGSSRSPSVCRSPSISSFR